MFQGGVFLLFVHIFYAKSELRSYSSTLRDGYSGDQKGEMPNRIQKPKIKMTSQNENGVVRGFSLVPWRDCATLKGRTTVVLGIWLMRLPRRALMMLSVGGYETRPYGDVQVIA